jgi:hypothetical protein
LDIGFHIKIYALEFAESETNVTAQLGGSVFLHCSVLSSGDRAVTYPTVRLFFSLGSADL